MLGTLPGSKVQMHGDYTGLFSGSAALCVLIGGVVNLLAIQDEQGRRGSESHGSLRDRLRARYRAHPAAVRFQFGLLIGAVVLLGASCVSLALA
jgi:hypothetical protein